MRQCADAEAAARSIRETRLLLKREQRMHSKGKGWLRRDEEEEKPVAWRAIEGLSEALRAQLLYDKTLQADPTAPQAQAEHLIRFVPQRFQHALSDLLLDDERLLAFLERPLLHHRTGWLGMQTWRSNEGLFLITDRQVLWLRDFLAPGSSFLPGGYIARMAPLERLQGIALLPAGRAPDEFAGRLESCVAPCCWVRTVTPFGGSCEPQGAARRQPAGQPACQPANLEGCVAGWCRRHNYLVNKILVAFILGQPASLPHCLGYVGHACAPHTSPTDPGASQRGGARRKPLSRIGPAKPARKDTAPTDGRRPERLDDLMQFLYRRQHGNFFLLEFGLCRFDGGRAFNDRRAGKGIGGIQLDRHNLIRGEQLADQWFVVGGETDELLVIG